jgi:hypothetical protein
MAGPERRDVVGGWVKSADPKLFETVTKQVFQEWLDRR